MSSQHKRSKQTLLKVICWVITGASTACTLIGIAALVAQVFKPESTNYPTKIALSDLIPSKDFAATIKQSQDQLALYLRSRFSTNLQTRLSAYNTAGPRDSILQQDCLDELNRIIEGPNIYDPARFAGVILKDRTQRLIQQNPIGRQAVQLNRLLIEDSYFDLITGTPDGFWDIVDKANGTFGGAYTALFFLLSGLGSLLLIFTNHFNSSEERVFGLVERNSRQLEKASAFGAISDLYPPLTLSPPLQKLFREHFGGAAIEGEPALRISASKGLCHVTIQSEALYYSLLCSLCRSFAADIDQVWRTHVLLPNGISCMFVPEIIQLLHAVPVQHRYYFFRNNFLDYDRKLMANSRAKPDTLHLLSTFAKASRILFRDQGASFGFLDARGHRTIWQGRAREFLKFRCACERLKLHLASNDTIVSAYVVRNSDSYEFEQGCIQMGDDASTTEFFKCLETAAANNNWEKAVEWDKFPVEVALISGEEMEARGKETVRVKAIDDYKLEGVGGGWLVAGDPRNLVWLKSVAASLKGATIQRLFLVDGSLFQADKANNNSTEILELFKTTALQQKFLTETTDGRQRGGIKLVDKGAAILGHKCFSKWKARGKFPDYWILTADENGSERIEGGVAFEPEARYVNPEDSDWLQLFNHLWTAGKEFPACFSPVASVIKEKRNEIYEDMVKRNELCQAEEKETDFKNRLHNWLNEQLDAI